MTSDETSNVIRVCAAVLSDDGILMVRHQHGNSDYWTLPGGHVERGETDEEAVLRELSEETGLRGSVIRHLFDSPTAAGRCACYLVDVENPGSAALGLDPELAANAQWIIELRWFPMAEKADDFQVAQVLDAICS